MFGEGVLIFIALVFIAVFLLAQGMAVPMFGDNRQAAKRLKHRVKQLEQFDDGDAEIGSLLRDRSMKHLAPWERTLETLPLLMPLSEHIRQSGNSLPAYRLVLLSAVLALIPGFIAWQLLRSEEIVLAVGTIGAALPFLKISSDRRKRFAKLEEQLPEAIDVMQRALKAGHPFNGTLKLVAEDMEGPIAREFELTFADINYGNDVRRAMLGLLARVPSITVMALVTSVLVQKETGGNLAEILKQLSAVVRSRFQFQRRVRTLSAEGRMSAWVLAMVPLVLVAVLTATSPDYLPELFNDPTGQKLAAFAAVWGAIGIYVLRRIIRINV